MGCGRTDENLGQTLNADDEIASSDRADRCLGISPQSAFCRADSRPDQGSGVFGVRSP